MPDLFAPLGFVGDSSVKYVSHWVLNRYVEVSSSESSILSTDLLISDLTVLCSVCTRWLGMLWPLRAFESWRLEEYRESCPSASSRSRAYNLALTTRTSYLPSSTSA